MNTHLMFLLAEKKGWGGLPPEEQLEKVMSLYEGVVSEFVDRVVPLLSAEAAEEMYGMLDKGEGFQDIVEFVGKHVDAGKILMEVVNSVG
jgi:hypothetical protein